LDQNSSAQLERQVPGPTLGNKEPSLLVGAPSRSARPALDRSRLPSHRQRALLFLLVPAAAVFAWWISGYLFAYTDDAYVTSDVVSITPEVTGPIEAVHVTDNEWVGRGTLLFTIDPVPFRLAEEQARAAVARQDYASALPPLGEHARRFKNGRLAEEREALHVRALAGLGRTDEARRAAHRFEARFPRSVLLPAVKQMSASAL